MLLRLHQKIAPEWVSNLVGLFEILSFARGSKDSKLYIFGFSRGAYTSRILAGMIYAIGIYDLSPFEKKDRLTISSQLYDTYKGKNKDIKSIRQQCAGIINKWRETLSSEISSNLNPDYSATIQVLGLWDTVEALGARPTLEAVNERVLGIRDPQEIINPNNRYIDQICNVKHIYHALALDDNRANVFTPIIISSDHVVSTCKPEDSAIEKVEEVWFSGAHSDVGGGYSKNDNNKKGDNTDRDVSLSGISLNWMMSKIKALYEIEWVAQFIVRPSEGTRNPIFRTGSRPC
jgi:uncharacterized protein (DUF2235 family)